MRAVVIGWLVVWASAVVVWRYFAAVHCEQNDRDGRLDRREASLDAWSADLGVVYAADVLRARGIADADALLERALGPTPSRVDDGSPV